MSENIVKVKIILNINKGELDNYLTFCEDVISNKILDRCNIDTIPKRLNSLIQEFLIEQYKLNENGIGEGKTKAVSASDNGQTVNFQVIGGTDTMSRNAEEFLDRNMSTLVSYRKIRR